MRLWLDSSRKRDFAFVSHAHADHSARHKKILASHATSRLLQCRLGIEAELAVDYGESVGIGKGTLTLYPSGHILGSSQILIEQGGERLLYTGDFKLASSLTAEPCQPVECDHLIMECTYGLPQYRFPDRSEVEQRLMDYIEDVQKRGEIPIILAYALGRAQELTRLLTAAGFRVAMEKRIFDIAQAYEELGVDLGDFESYDSGDLDGRVLLFPPHLWKAPVLQQIPNKRMIAVTGWAVDGRQKSWYRTDAAFPLSDHADFDDLIRYVEITRPRSVYLIHGFPEFAQHLEDLGVNVYFLES